ncbi:MAG: hypothetical protein PHC83_03410 [Bacteroidales bacterium]|nr:hypothetical protein [Bacteroidales bacterium]MDD4209402.1 hypothetical protein [Bacteroidales bacterium]
MRKLGYLTSICMCMAACDTQPSTIPIRNVNFTVSINTTKLVHIGGYEYFTGGISGIIIYRFDMTTFYAYDRACPYDWEKGGRVSVVDLKLHDSLCKSTFNLLNGYPYSGSKAEQPLRQYQATLIDDITLQVYN